MPQFGGRSLTAMKTLHPQLARVLNLAIANFDFIIIQTSRTQEEQEADFKKGVSKAHWGQSAHDFDPSLAADCAPLPLHWSNIPSFNALAGAIKLASKQLSIPITWGGDFPPGTIKDYPHFELASWRDIAAKLPQQQRLPLVS